MFAQTTSYRMLPEQASTFSADVDPLFWFIYWLSIFFFLLIVGLMIYFVVQYRRRDTDAPLGVPHHNRNLEIFWTVIPLLLTVVIFVWGFLGFMNMRQPPEQGYEIAVMAKQWGWNFQYPDVAVDTSDELHVAAGETFILTLRSQDVIHSLSIPAFRAKMDVVPGRYSKMWFQPTKEGEYDLFCTEYCGTGHSNMNVKVVVHPTMGDLQRWLNDERERRIKERMENPAEYGAELYKSRGCAQCHSLDGSKKVGPSFLGLWGDENHQVRVGGESGPVETVAVDENYILESIWEPGAKVVVGYGNKMPAFKGQLSEDDVNALIAYLKTLKK